MKVVAFNASARKNGNTQVLIDAVLQELELENIETERVSLAGAPVRGCQACYACFKTQNKQCVFQDDVINACITKMAAADGIILASPTYFANVSTEMKALIDRAGMVGRANSSLYRRKVGAAVVAVRRAGAIHTFNSINHFFFISEMIVPGSSYWNIGTGREPGEAAKDQEGIQTMRVLGKNMAWLLQRIAADAKQGLK